MHAGVAPLVASSGKSVRHRLNRCGNRSLNSALHMIAVTQARMHPPAIAYMARKHGEGMSTGRRCAASSATSRGPSSRRCAGPSWHGRRYAVDIGART